MSIKLLDYQTSYEKKKKKKKRHTQNLSSPFLSLEFKVKFLIIWSLRTQELLLFLCMTQEVAKLYIQKIE